MAIVISIVGKSDSGKTSLLERLVPEIKKRGYKVGTIKHNTRGFELDHKGKDSWRHKQAGAQCVVLSGPSQIAMIRDVEKELTVHEIISKYLNDMDVVLTEGYKKEDHLKIEIFRKDGPHKDMICKNDKNLIALVTDKEMFIPIPCFGLQDIVQLVDFLEKNYFTVKNK
jgi:molybdopterin-guanine dinucleotide biosynthesis protein B